MYATRNPFAFQVRILIRVDEVTNSYKGMTKIIIYNEKRHSLHSTPLYSSD